MEEQFSLTSSTLRNIVKLYSAKSLEWKPPKSPVEPQDLPIIPRIPDPQDVFEVFC